MASRSSKFLLKSGIFSVLVGYCPLARYLQKEALPMNARIVVSTLVGLSLIASAAVAMAKHTPPHTPVSAPSRRVLSCQGYQVELDGETQGVNARNRGNWGSSFDSHRVDVCTLTVTYKGQAVRVPASTYTDLSDASEFSVSPSLHGCTVHLHGGDAGSAYTCAIEIANGNVVSRTVHSDEFPDEAKETTVYSSIPDDGR